MIETKGQAETDEDLEHEIKEFSSKIERLRRRLPEFAREVGFESKVATLSGIFVSMADLQHYERGSYGIELWDYHRFTQELQQSGISTEYIKLLEMTRLTFLMNGLWGFPDQSLYGGEPPDADDWADD